MFGRVDRMDGAASCRETGVFRDVHSTYAISRNPRCIGGGGRRSRFVSHSHRNIVAIAITGDEFSFSSLAGNLRPFFSFSPT